jgi:hypothetical protein
LEEGPPYPRLKVGDLNERVELGGEHDARIAQKTRHAILPHYVADALRVYVSPRDSGDMN